MIKSYTNSRLLYFLYYCHLRFNPQWRYLIFRWQMRLLEYRTLVSYNGWYFFSSFCDSFYHISFVLFLIVLDYADMVSSRFWVHVELPRISAYMVGAYTVLLMAVFLHWIQRLDGVSWSVSCYTFGTADSVYQMTSLRQLARFCLDFKELTFYLLPWPSVGSSIKRRRWFVLSRVNLVTSSPADYRLGPIQLHYEQETHQEMR